MGVLEGVAPRQAPVINIGQRLRIPSAVARAVTVAAVTRPAANENDFRRKLA